MPRPRGNGPGVGGPAKGAGWGGEANGAGRGREMMDPFTGNEPTRGAILDNTDGDEQTYRAQQRAERRDLRRRMMAVLVQNAEDKTNPGATQVVAADKVLDRIDGKATQRNEITGADGETMKIEMTSRWLLTTCAPWVARTSSTPTPCSGRR